MMITIFAINNFYCCTTLLYKKQLRCYTNGKAQKTPSGVNSDSLN